MSILRKEGAGKESAVWNSAVLFSNLSTVWERQKSHENVEIRLPFAKLYLQNKIILSLMTVVRILVSSFVCELTNLTFLRNYHY